MKDKITLKLFILNYFGFSQVDEYLYNHFNKKNYKMAQAMWDAFPLSETCDHFYSYGQNYKKVVYNYIKE